MKATIEIKNMLTSMSLFLPGTNILPTSPLVSMLAIGFGIIIFDFWFADFGFGQQLILLRAPHTFIMYRAG